MRLNRSGIRSLLSKPNCPLSLFTTTSSSAAAAAIRRPATTTTTIASSSALFLSSSTTTSSSTAEENIAKLKKVLEREYVSFFDPMRTEYYSPQVTFDDPLTNLEGVAAYQNNVDMLASRTLLGKFLFQDAGIVLHNIEGGEIQEDGVTVSDIITRWTLRMTASVLPWKPTARFTGISVYKVQLDPNNGDVGVTIMGQTDYWDSVNLIEGGTYSGKPKLEALTDMLQQMAPGGFQASPAAPEVPYQLLRRGSDYEVRQYPAMCVVKMKYGRRDEGFGSLGAFCKGMTPMGPAMMNVDLEDGDEKFMMWPLTFASPNDITAPSVPLAEEKSITDPQWRKCQVLSMPSKVIAVKDFTDASMGPVVKKADRELRASLQRDGLQPSSSSEGSVSFAQYDAIFSMGQRRGECWIELEPNTHPWSSTT